MLVELLLPVILAPLASLSLSRVRPFRAVGTLHQLMIGAGIGVVALLVYAYTRHLVAWVQTNGYAYTGVCRGYVLCDLREYVSAQHFFGSAFGLFGFVVIGSFWMSSWMVCWLLSSQPVGKGATTQVPQPRAPWPALGTLTIFLTGLASCVAVCRMAPQSPELISSTAYTKAWGLTDEAKQLIDEGVKVGPNPESQVMVWFAVPAGPLRDFERRWPAECWFASSDAPSWLTKPFAGIDPPLPWKSEPPVAPPHPERDDRVLFGIRLAERQAGRGEAQWARSFSEARERLMQGDLAWNWFAVAVDEDMGSSLEALVTFAHRGFEEDMTDWMPICNP